MKKLVAKKEAAISLRILGKSIPAIAKELNVSKSSVSLWVNKVKLPKAITGRLAKNFSDGRQKGLEMIRVRKELELNQILQDASSHISHLMKRKDIILLQLSSALLFWCEGQKDLSGGIKFTNSDPKLVQVFLFCLRQGFTIKEEKFRALIHLHDYHDVEKQTKFWSDITGIPKNQFQAPYRKAHSGIRKRENYPGCISIRYYDVFLARRLFALYYAFGKLT